MINLRRPFEFRLIAREVQVTYGSYVLCATTRSALNDVPGKYSTVPGQEHLEG